MTETAAATPEGTAAAVFLRQSQPAPHTCRVPVRQTCLSSSPDLRLLSSPTAFSDCSNDRLSPCVAVSALTVAVPFVNFTRFPILRRGCYHLRRHLNCHSLFVPSIARTRGFVNHKIGIALWEKIWYDGQNQIYSHPFFGMGKSQRYQAAVDGHTSRPLSLEQSEKARTLWRPESEYGG